MYADENARRGREGESMRMMRVEERGRFSTPGRMRGVKEREREKGRVRMRDREVE